MTSLRLAFVGMDVVRPLVARNQSLFGSGCVRFVELDIVDDELPDGDVWT